jgi:hypothetical protein
MNADKTMQPSGLAQVPCSAFVLSHFPKPSSPRKKHQCRICGQVIAVKEPCCIWSGVTPGEGFWTCHTHPECFDLTKDWDDSDWELMAPGDEPRLNVRMYWPNVEALPAEGREGL